MGRRVFLFTFLVICLLSVSVEAVKWVRLGGGKGLTLYVDSDSVSGRPEEAREAWFMFEFDPPDCSARTGQKQQKCIVRLCYYEMHYRDRTLCLHQSVEYFTDGTNSGAQTYSCIREKVIPGAISELKWNYLYR